MFGISSFEFLLILLVALMVLGPDKLPKIMRTLTRVMSEFRRVKTDFQRVMNTELAFQDQLEREQRQKSLERGIQARQQAEREAEQLATTDTEQQAMPPTEQAAREAEQQGLPPADQNAAPSTVPTSAAATGGLTGAARQASAPKPTENHGAGSEPEEQP